jgi:hypothetical protein
VADYVIVRKRIIPDEETELKNDEIICADYERRCIVTRWLPIKPRKDIGWGFSVYYFERKLKISAIFDRKGEFSCIYCDIISSILRNNRLIVTDLLVDVTRDREGNVKVLDEDELQYAITRGLISGEDAKTALEGVRTAVELLEDPEFFPGKELGLIIEPTEGFKRD